jgi:hypothetical protein
MTTKFTQFEPELGDIVEEPMIGCSAAYLVIGRTPSTVTLERLNRGRIVELSEYPTVVFYEAVPFDDDDPLKSDPITLHRRKDNGYRRDQAKHGIQIGRHHDGIPLIYTIYVPTPTGPFL